MNNPFIPHTTVVAEFAHDLAVKIKKDPYDEASREGLVFLLSENGPGLEENIRTIAREGLLKPQAFSAAYNILGALFKTKLDLLPPAISEKQGIEKGFKDAKKLLGEHEDPSFGPHITTLIRDLRNPDNTEVSLMATQLIQNAYNEPCSFFKTKRSVLQHLKVREDAFHKRAKALGLSL
ncbi:MAG: hypothetical protein FWF24_03310 [Alphaproteobacteria bacterium]|nr:hypothetical protein [Alphaproteobacteria bacterium]